jgi:hypothetical protein
MRRISRTLGLAVLGVAASGVLAQSQPASSQAQPESLNATITAVQGPLAEVRVAPDKPWQSAKVGMKVPEGGEFRTGPRSSVQFLIEPDQTITVARLGVVKLLEAINDNGKLKTSVGMKYGRTRFDIEAAGREHEASISTPSSTLAVRGTHFLAIDERPFPARGISFEGVVSFRDGKKQINFGGRNTGRSTVSVDQPSAAALALAQTTIDPSTPLARSAAEAPLIDQLLKGGSTVFFDREAQIKVVTGGQVPTDQQLIPTLPGAINFVARWHSDADLNLSVSTPGGPNNGGETLYPIGALSSSSSGGKVAFDHRGGPNGGIEVIYFPTTNVPDGFYSIGLTLVRGPTTTAQVDVFQDGKRINIFAGSQGNVPSATVQVPPPIPGFVDGTAVGVVPVGLPIPMSAAAPKAQRSSAPAKTKVAVAPAPQTAKPRK